MIVKTDFNKDILANIGVLEKFLYQDSRTGLKLTEFALATRDFSILTEGAPVFIRFSPRLSLGSQFTPGRCIL